DGNDIAEVVQARGGEPLLKDRLNKTDEQLAETVDKTSGIVGDFNGQYYEGAIISFAFDDARVHDWNKFKPIFEDENVPGCVCAVTKFVGEEGRMTWEQLKYLKSIGWTVASHTHTHPPVRDMSEDEIEYEYKTSHELLKRHGLDYDILVQPLGQATSKSLAIQRKYYKMGINIVRDHL